MSKVNESKNVNSIVSSTIRISIAVIIIKALGFVKQMVIASKFGASVETDAFFISTGVISSLANVFFSAISITLLSLYTQNEVEKGKNAADKLISATLKTFIPISGMLAIFFVIFSPIISKFLAPSYTGSATDLLSFYIRIMAGCFVLSCYHLTLNVVLEKEKIFLPGKGLSLFQNVFLILAAVFFSNHFGVTTLVIAFVLAAGIQCIFISFCVRNRFHFSPDTKDCEEDIRELLKISVPLIAGNAIYEINDIVDKQIASRYGGGASILSYGASLNEMVTTVIIMSLSTVLFSYYATWAANREFNRIGNNIKKSMEYLIVLIVPIMAICVVLGEDIVFVMYGRGQFGSNEVKQTYWVLVGYAIGFIFQAARATIVKVFYALKCTKIPMINGVIAVAINILLSMILYNYLGVGGIAVATSIAMLLVTILLLMRLPQLIPDFSLKSSIPEYGKAICAGSITAIFISFLHACITISIFAKLILCSSVEVIFYVIVMYIMKSRCLEELINRIKR